MSLEFRPNGVGCNIACDYCYQDTTRAAGHATAYDKAKVWDALSTTTEYWALFGGEALLLPQAQLRELLALGFARFGKTGVQTNGTLITDRHVEMFDEYRTEVGISLDGPEDLNDVRWAGTLEATRKMTARTEQALATLCEKGLREEKPWLVPTLIVTLHAGNIGTPARADRLIAWFHALDAMGVRHVNLHAMEMDARAAQWALPQDETLAFLRRLWDELPFFSGLRFQTFNEILQLLRGHDESACCIWHACDPWNTGAVQGLEGDGSPSHCTRTNKDGKPWLPASGTGVATRHAIGGFAGNRYHERQLALYVTPQRDGGCQDCRFWLMCQGQCPGTGDASAVEPQGDWRLRTSHCGLWQGLFEEGERRLLAVDERPVSLWANRAELEARMYRHWADGREPSMHAVIAESREQSHAPSPAAPHGDGIVHLEGNGHGDRPHGDHTPEAPHGDVPHGDHTPEGPHGDVPHGDQHENTHGDHTDQRHADAPMSTKHGDHGDHGDSGPTGHGDKHMNAHGNAHGDQTPEGEHGDIPHGDQHGDHTDTRVPVRFQDRPPQQGGPPCRQ